MSPTDQQACARCGALSRLDAAWCSLCLEPFHAPEPTVDPLTAPLELLDAEAAQPESGQPAPTAGSPSTSQVQVVDSEAVEAMLAQLAAEHRQADPLVAVTGRFGDRATRLVTMIGGFVVVTLVGFGLLALLGSLG